MTWRDYSAPPDPLAGFKGPTSKGREGRVEKGREGVGREKEGEGKGEGEGREGQGRGREYNVSRILAAACWQPYK